jgi:hypothetical protein
LLLGKFQLSREINAALKSSTSFTHEIVSHDNEIVASLESQFFKPAQIILKKLKKEVVSFSGCEEFSDTFLLRCILYEKLFMQYFLKVSVSLKRLHSRKHLQERHEIVSELIDEEISKTAFALEKNHIILESKMKELFERASSSKHSSGYFSRTTEMTHKLIKKNFLSAMSDVGAFFMLLIIVFTLVRLPHLIADLSRTHKAGASLFSDSAKFVVARHVKKIAYDLAYLARLLFCSIFIFATIGGIPHYITGSF